MRVLVVVPRFPATQHTGGDYVTDIFIRELMTLAETYLLAIGTVPARTQLPDSGHIFSCSRANHSSLTKVLSSLPALALWARGADAQRCILSLVREYGIQVIIVSHIYAGVNLPEQVPARVLFLVHNIDSQRLGFLSEDQADLLRAAWLRLQARRMRRFEHRMLHRAHAVLALSRSDAAHLRCRSGSRYRTIVTPVPPDEALLQLPCTGRPSRTVLFVGSLAYQPNVAAARFLADAVMPLLVRQHPEATLIIAGSSPPAGLQRSILRHRNATLVADFGSNGELFGGATVFVAPMARQTGISVKTLNALASGTPVVATAPVLASLGAVSGLHALQAETAAEFASQIDRLFACGNLRDRLGQAGRAHVREHFSRAALRAAISEALF